MYEHGWGKKLNYVIATSGASRPLVLGTSGVTAPVCS
jgi:hypothetical protein